MTPDQIVAIVLALTSPQPAEPLFPVIADGGADPRYPVVASPCPRPLTPYEVEGRTVACGKVSVPENHAAPEGRRISLTFMIFKSRSLSLRSFRMMRVSCIFWKPWFGGQPLHLDLKGKGRVIHGVSGLFDADVVVVHAPSLLTSGQRQEIEILRKNTRPEQVWIMESHESSANYPEQCNTTFRLLFDAEMSHRLTADIWVPYFSGRSFDDYSGLDMQGRTDLCCAFVSSGINRSGREEYLTELMKHVDIASYGQFQNNRRLHHDAGASTKLAVMRRFTYAIAFENSIEADYVTEKMFDPLGVGTIPIYLGAPNVDEFLPGDACCIDASNYPDPKTLAQVMRDTDPQTFHLWRGRPLRPSIREKLERISAPFEERFAAVVEPLLASKRRALKPHAPAGVVIATTGDGAMDQTQTCLAPADLVDGGDNGS